MAVCMIPSNHQYVQQSRYVVGAQNMYKLHVLVAQAPT